MMRLGAIVRVAIALVVVLLTAFTGNSDSIDSWNIQDDAVLPAGNLDDVRTIGQTFRAHEARMHAIQVRWVVSSDIKFAPSGQILLHVRRNPGDSTDAATAAIAAIDVRTNEYGKFVFAPIADSAGESFYFFLDASKAGVQRGSLSAWSSAQDDYPDGQLFIDGQPTRQDLVFRVYYDPDASMLWQALGNMLRMYLRTIPFVVFIAIVPGLILLYASGEFAGRDAKRVDLFAFASGIGLAALSAGAFFLMWLEAASNAWAVYPLAASLAAVLGYLLIRKTKPTARPLVARNNQGNELASVALVILAALALGVALLQIRDVRAPLWVDSPVHASYIARIVDHAQMPLDRFYHLGYHAIVALVVRLTGDSIPDAMLLVGQLLLVQAGLSVYLLSRRLTGSALSGLASAVAVWFLSPTPAYFVTWGRYPLLLGSALLPIAMLGAMNMIDRARLDTWTFFFSGVTLVGLTFAQVRLVVFYFVFVIAYAANYLWDHRRDPSAKQILFRIGLLGGIGIFFAGLWMVALIARGSSLQTIIETNAGAPLIDLAVGWDVIFSHHGLELMVLAAVTVLAGLLRRSILATTVSSWYIGICLISLVSQSIGGRPYFEPSLVVLMGFLPAALLVGDLAKFLSTKWTSACSMASSSATVVSVILISMVGLAGVKDMIALVNPATILFFDADQSAMQWIEKHTPTNAKFLINSYAWFDSNYVPSDGGSWMPYMTGRTVDFLPADAFTGNRDTGEIMRWMTERKIAFVYLGRRAGILGKFDFISQPEHFALIYDRDGVQIFQIQSPGDAAGPGG